MAETPPATHDRRAGTAAAEAALWEMSLDMLATANVDGYLTRLNPSWEQTLGYTADELMSRPYLDFVHPDDAQRTRAEATHLSRPAHASVGFVNRYRHRDGTYRWLSWHSQLGADDRTIFCVVRDVTESREREQAINELNRILTEQARDLERSNRDLEQFAYVASHDLSEPLRSVTGYVQLLARRYQGRLDADADEFIGYAVDGVARMQALIRDLLAYARAGVCGEPVRVDCAELVNDIVDAARTSQPGALFEVGPMPVVTSEPAHLRQVFDNLVSNALKFVPPDRPPRVTVSSRMLESAWEFSVADNGIGIDAQYSERIFGMYQRLHARTDYPGTGIGLAICRRVVERLGGRISVDSTLGAGTTFTFTIPSPVEAGHG
ncbi:MAG: sensor histidine kinase [Candidatus Dormibacteria bacterium]